MKLQTIDIPEEAPVMVLPNAPLLPLTLLPLSIFEPRYRQMLAYALEHDRMFCIALTRPGIAEAVAPDDFFETVGIGLIRACVELEDGTSNLILQGLERMKITGWVQDHPFRVARLQRLSSEAGESVEAEALATKVMELCGELKALGLQMPVPIQKRLEIINDPAVLGDIVSNAFVRDPFTRQQLLEEPLVPSRLRRIIAILKTELGS